MTIEEKTTLRSRIAKGLGAQGYAQAVQILIRFVEIPLLLGYWGTQLYGEWLMLAAIPACLSICDVGFAGAASREMSIRSGRGDKAGALSIFQSTWLLLLLISFIVGLSVFLGVFYAPLHAWFGFKAMLPETVRLVTIILFLHVLTGFQVGLVYGGFWCEGRYALGMALHATLQLLEFGGLALAVVFVGGPVSAAFGYLGGRLVGLCLMRLGLIRATPWLHYGYRQANMIEVKRLVAPAMASLTFPFGNSINIQGMQLMVGFVLGPASVVVFSVLRTLSRIAMQPSQVINRLIEPELAIAYGSNRREDFKRLFNNSCQVTLWFSAALCIILGVLGSKFLVLWAQGKVVMDWPLYILFLMSAAINSVWFTALVAAYATNRHVGIAFVYTIVYGLLAIFIAFALMNLSGITGAGLAILLSELMMAYYILPKMLMLAGESFASWTNKVSTPPWFLIREDNI